MTARAVEAVFFWRFSATTFKAVYGRRPGGTTYTKDFFQSPGGQWPVIDSVLHRPAEGEVPVEYRWPGGTKSGTWRRSAADPRGQMAWGTSETAPTPWRIGEPASDPAIAIAGDPSKKTVAEADAIFEEIESRNEQPWFLAVKLYDEPDILYPRVCFENPPEGLQGRSFSSLPRVIQKAMADLSAAAGGGAIKLPRVRTPNLVGRILTALETDTNVLLVGPPGTGKTVAMEDFSSLFDAENGAALFDPDTLDDPWNLGVIADDDEQKAIYMVFHPSYEYEEFVAGLVPVPEAQGFRLDARPGPFLSLAHWTMGKRRGLLLIDEFNRGNAAAIFGDMLPLLDSSKRRGRNGPGIAVLRPYSQYSMLVDEQFQQPDGNVSLPHNISVSDRLWIVAALNSTDRSVAPLDAALRRRFAIIPVEPDYDALAKQWGIGVPAFGEPFASGTKAWPSVTRNEVFELGLRILYSLNERIAFVIGRDFLLGQALLWPVSGNSADEVMRSLARAVDERILSTLRLTFVDQDDSLAAILKARSPMTGEPAAAGPALTHWDNPPEEMAAAVPRLRINQVHGLQPPAMWEVLKSLV